MQEARAARDSFPLMINIETLPRDIVVQMHSHRDSEFRVPRTEAQLKHSLRQWEVHVPSRSS